MPEQFQNVAATKPEVDTTNAQSAQEKIDSAAEKAAEKPAKTEKKYDKENNKLFSK